MSQPSNEAIDALYQSDMATAKTIFAQICKNCLVAGRGIQNHGHNACAKLGHKCVIPCPKCRGIHWVFDCNQ